LTLPTRSVIVTSRRKLGFVDPTDGGKPSLVFVKFQRFHSGDKRPLGSLAIVAGVVILPNIPSIAGIPAPPPIHPALFARRRVVYDMPC
jgi:hypothetical protein